MMLPPESQLTPGTGWDALAVLVVLVLMLPPWVMIPLVFPTWLYLRRGRQRS